MNKRTVWIFGLLAGAFVSSALLIGVSSQKNASSMGWSLAFGYSGMIVAGAILIVGMSRMTLILKRNTVPYLMHGLGMAAIASLVYTVSWMGFLRITGYDFKAHYAQLIENQMVEQGKSAEEIAARLAQNAEQMAAYDQPHIQAVLTFSEIFPVLMVLVLLGGWILSIRARKTQTEAV
ncbi:DUF4199 family protein [bacterium]|nr:DUF4199 family protein [bacterium]